ncbi:MAG: trypsin-like peptidase domain-containing protein [Myxococcota bacterium]|nr:trypsin-like peptidase domain-containing protein [Myxococcota bacterium]
MKSRSKLLPLAALAVGTVAASVVFAQQPSPEPSVAEPSAAEPSAEVAAPARALEAAFTEVAARVSRSVVAIRVEARAEGREATSRGNGSGVIIREDGYVLTNHHVVGDALRIEVELQDGRRAPAEVIGVDPATDLAVIRIAARGLPVARFASEPVRPGQWSIAIGSPFGLDYSVTTGVVSSVGRGLGMNEIEDFVQTDASINPGNSGGPLVDLDGRVIGINTMILGRASGIGFAVSAELSQRVAEHLIAHGRVRRPWIGVQFQELTPALAQAFSLGDRARVGALIADVVPGGPAARAGLRPGDVVVDVDGERVGASRDLLRAILRKDIGTPVRLAVMREGRPTALTLPTEERPTEERPGAERATRRNAPPPEAGPTEGLRLSRLSPAQQRRLGGAGVMVHGVAPGSDADRAGLRPGDVVVAADGATVTEPAQIAAALEDGSALLRVRRGDGAIYTVLED